jgi:ribose transport system substrate-binding protein
MKRSLLLLLTCCAFLAVPALAADKIRIAVIPMGTTHVYWKAVESGAKAAATAAGVEVVYVGPEKEDSRQQQIALFETQLLNGVNAICMAPLDAVALRAPVMKAKRAKVPVVIFDSVLKDGDTITAGYVGTDNFGAGEKAGQGMIEALGGKGRVIMLRYAQGAASATAREEGFLQALKKAPGIEVVSSEQYGGATVAEALNASKNLLLRFSGEKQPDGIFCPNQSTTYGMLQALEQNGLAGKIKFVGFDPTLALVDALKKGSLTGIIAQDPYRMGQLSVETALKAVKGETVPKVTDTGAAWVTPANVDTPEIQAVIKPQMN